MPPPPSAPPPPFIVAYTFPQIQVGTYDPAKPFGAGTSFRFVARDSDGLPVVGETYNGFPRVDGFRAELRWLGSNFGGDGVSAVSVGSTGAVSTTVAPVTWELPVRFIGNRAAQPDGSWLVLPDPPRAQDGTFHVTVSLRRTGPHTVRIKGPPADGSSLQPAEYFPWEARVMGICPAGQVPLDNPSYLCGCAAGTETAGGSTDSGTVTCNPCPIGQLKEQNGNDRCYSCTDALLKARGGDITFAASRTITAEPGASALHDCGCSAGFFLSHIGRAQASIDLSTTCPPIDSDTFLGRTRSFREGCCNETATSKECESMEARLCMRKKCKTEQLLTLEERRVDQPNISGACQQCALTPTGLLMEGAVCDGGMHKIERLHILPDYWRANELSEAVVACKTPGACVGTGTHLSLLDSPCGPNRTGPYCVRAAKIPTRMLYERPDLPHPTLRAHSGSLTHIRIPFVWQEVCFPAGSFFKNDFGNCTECKDLFSMFSPDSARTWLPFVVFVSVLVVSFAGYVIAKVREALKDKPATPLVWERLASKPKGGHEIFNRRLREGLRAKPAEPLVRFKKDEYDRFRMKLVLTPKHFITLPDKSGAGGPPLYFRPIDMSEVEAARSWRRFLPRSPLRHCAPGTRLGDSRPLRFIRKVFRILRMPFVWLAIAVLFLVRIVKKILGVIQRSMAKMVKFVTTQKHKVKILLSMFQVMDGLQGSFNLLLPISFTSLLKNLNFLMFSLPLDCVFPTDFHITMAYRTALPLLVELVLLGVAFFASSRVPQAEYADRRKPRSKLMMQHLASQDTGRDSVQGRLNWAILSGVSPTEGQGGSFAVVPVTPTPSNGKRTSRFLSSISGLTPTRRRDGEGKVLPTPSPPPSPPAAGTSRMLGRRHAQIEPLANSFLKAGATHQGGASTSTEAGSGELKQRVVDAPRPPPPAPLVRQTSQRVRAQVAAFKEAMTQAAIREVNEEVRVARKLKRSATVLGIVGVANFFSPQGWLAIATAVLVNSIEDADQRMRREGRQVSLAQLQLKQQTLGRLKRRYRLARTFVLLADILAILTSGLGSIVGAVSLVAEGSAFPRIISISLLGVGAAQFVLLLSATHTFILADKQLFMAELKLADLKLAQQASAERETQANKEDDSGSRSSRDSKSSKSSRASSARGRDATRQYWTALQSKCIDNCFAILFLFYPSCSAITFQTCATGLDPCGP